MDTASPWEAYLPQLRLDRSDGIGVAMVDELLSPVAVAAARSDCEALHDAGRMSLAGMGTGDASWHESAVRGDKILWLGSLLPSSSGQDDVGMPPGLQCAVRSLVAVQKQLRSCAPHLRLNGTTSMQLACYVRHVP